jgi:hypothetical protein
VILIGNRKRSARDARVMRTETAGMSAEKIPVIRGWMTGATEELQMEELTGAQTNVSLLPRLPMLQHRPPTAERETVDTKTTTRAVKPRNENAVLVMRTEPEDLAEHRRPRIVTMTDLATTWTRNLLATANVAKNQRLLLIRMRNTVVESN